MFPSTVFMIDFDIAVQDFIHPYPNSMWGH